MPTFFKELMINCKSCLHAQASSPTPHILLSQSGRVSRGICTQDDLLINKYSLSALKEDGIMGHCSGRSRMVWCHR